MAQQTKNQLHLVARDLRFVSGMERGVRDTFEVLDSAGTVIATIYMAAANATDLRDHIVQKG